LLGLKDRGNSAAFRLTTNLTGWRVESQDLAPLDAEETSPRGNKLLFDFHEKARASLMATYHFGGRILSAGARHAAGVIQGNFPGGRPRLLMFGTRSSTAPVQPFAAKAEPRVRPNATLLEPGATLFRQPSPGRSMPEVIQRQMERLFRANFSDVRIHVGPQAGSIGALAFTQGSDIFFAPGQYNPTSSAGLRALGQQLAYVVQQRSGRVHNPFGAGTAVVTDPRFKAEAELMGLRACMPRPAQPRMNPVQQPSAARRSSLAPTPQGRPGNPPNAGVVPARAGVKIPIAGTPMRPGTVGMPATAHGAHLAPASMPRAISTAPVHGPHGSKVPAGRRNPAHGSSGAILPSLRAPLAAGQRSSTQPGARIMMAFGSAVHRGRQFVQAALGSVGRRVFGS
jgi:Domain of unknown function (DUF4157)